MKNNHHILIGVASPSAIGGAERITINLCNNLHKRGYKITLAGKFDESIETHYPLDKGIARINIKHYIKEKSLKIKLDNLTNIIKRKLYKLLKYRNISVLRKSRIYNKIIWHMQYDIVLASWKLILTESKPDLVIGILPNTFTLLSLVLKDSQIPLITSNHNNPWKDYSLSRYSSNPVDLKYRLQASLIAGANTVLLPSFKSFFSTEVQNKTFVIPNPVYPIPTPNHANPSNNDGEKLIICTGRLTDIKDHKTLILAFNNIKAEFPDWVIKIYGDGPNFDMLNRIIIDNDLAKSVFLCGYAEDLGCVYSHAHILAIPSHFEGWGLSLTEGMSYGLPAIGFDNCSGVNSLIQHGTTGYLADGNDRIRSLAHYLKKLMNNSALRGEMGRTSLKFIQQYAPDIVFDLWEDAIQKTLNKNS